MLKKLHQNVPVALCRGRGHLPETGVCTHARYTHALKTRAGANTVSLNISWGLLHQSVLLNSSVIPRCVDVPFFIPY